MKLTKLNKAYTVVDEKDDQTTSGNITKTEDGELTIGLNTTLKSSLTQEVTQLGSAYYRSKDGKVNTNYNFEGNYNTEYVNYCETLISDILEQIGE